MFVLLLTLSLVLIILGVIGVIRECVKLFQGGSLVNFISALCCGMGVFVGAVYLVYLIA